MAAIQELAKGTDAEKPKALSLDERRERRRVRREKQRLQNIVRAEKMHVARTAGTIPTRLKNTVEAPVLIGCSGWFYWKWRGKFYPETLPTSGWFDHYATQFATVEINASFYSWPTIAGVKSWLRQIEERNFIFTVKVCELITHIKRFEATETLVLDFGKIADILGDRMGCFLFQLPPSYKFSEAKLDGILKQLDPMRRNVVEFRHASWWNETVYAAFRQTGTIFCSCSGPRLPNDLVRTADEIYLRLHGPDRWYRHDYSTEELQIWIDKIRSSGAKRSWIYFNNDYEGFAPTNAISMRNLLENRQLVETFDQ